MDKRYQVFISSTYQDLKEERAEVIQALLELDCIPAGMELFPAANDDQWSLIKKVIDDCDYYLLIIGGRYGSISSEGISYTQQEYEYALSRNIPIISFIHKNPEEISVGKSEKSEKGREKLEEFKNAVQKKMCKSWDTPESLGSVVSRSLIKLITSNPAIGWVKANNLPDKESVEEILELRRKIEQLENKLKTIVYNKPEGSDELSCGNETHQVKLIYIAGIMNNFTRRTVVEVSWNDLFLRMSPLLRNEANEDFMKTNISTDLSEFVEDSTKEEIITYFHKAVDDDDNEILGLNFHIKIEKQSFYEIINQFKALGYIQISDRKRSVKETGTFWTLTPYGDSIMTELLAIRKRDIGNEKR